MTDLVTFHKIDCKDLEDMLRSEFPELDIVEIKDYGHGPERYVHPWSIIAHQNWKNDSCYVLYIEDYEDDEAARMRAENEWKRYKNAESTHVPLHSYLLPELVRRKLLPDITENTILVSVCW